MDSIMRILLALPVEMWRLFLTMLCLLKKPIDYSLSCRIRFSLRPTQLSPCSCNMWICLRIYGFEW